MTPDGTVRRERLPEHALRPRCRTSVAHLLSRARPIPGRRRFNAPSLGGGREGPRGAFRTRSQAAPAVRARRRPRRGDSAALRIPVAEDRLQEPCGTAWVYPWRPMRTRPSKLSPLVPASGLFLASGAGLAQRVLALFRCAQRTQDAAVPDRSRRNALHPCPFRWIQSDRTRRLRPMRTRRSMATSGDTGAAPLPGPRPWRGSTPRGAPLEPGVQLWVRPDHLSARFTLRLQVRRGGLP